MGFYGNLTNTARTQFQFDRIYPNRYSMEAGIKTDGIYIGRYVLVEYDADVHESNITVAYLSDNHFYTTINLNQHFLLNTYSAVAANVVTPDNFSSYYVEENGLHRLASGYDAETVYYELTSGRDGAGVELNEIIQTRNIMGELTGQFWKCTGVDTFGYAVFEDITESEENNYLINYNIDITYYGPRQPEGAYSRAWDSTVWQKIYAEGEVKYIMIAELNTAAPSFSMTFDIPTQTPLAPHVDSSSSNNVYRIHLQPTWGFRVKEEEDEKLSDLKVYHINSEFDSKTNYINQFKTQVNGALYWNKEGFDITKSVHSSDNENYITIEPTGKSGLQYNSHKGYVLTEDETYQEDKDYYNYASGLGEYTKINSTSLIGQIIEGNVYELVELDTYDINEFTLHLPAIGNAVADFYDLMYGVNHNNRDLRYRDTEWKYYHNNGNLDGPLSNLGGMTTDLTTVAGSINYLHNLEGMIIAILDSMPSPQEVQTLSSEFIYCLRGDNIHTANKYYYRAQTYKFDTSRVNYSYVKITNEEYVPNCYFTLNSGATFNVNNLVTDLGNNSYNSSKDYYKRLLGEAVYKLVGTLIDYTPSYYYYNVGTDYYVELSDSFDKERQYYDFNYDKYRAVQLNENLEFLRDYYFDIGGLDFSIQENADLLASYDNNTWIPLGWFDTTDTNFNGFKTYYELAGTSLILYNSYGEGDPIPTDRRIVEVVDRSNWREMKVSDIAVPSELANKAGVRIITEKGTIFDISYQANVYYYFEQTGTIQPQINGTTYPVYDYKIDKNYPFTENRNYYTQTPYLVPNATFYYPNAYFYFDNDDGEHDPFDATLDGPGQNSASTLANLDNADYPTLDRHYWFLELSAPHWVLNSNNEWIYVQTVLGWRRVTNMLSVTGQWIIYNEETTLNELSPATPSFKYYYKTINDDTYHMLHTENRNTVCANATNTFYTFDVNNIEDMEHYSNDQFYVGSMYYYFGNNNNLILDQSNTHTPGRNYYTFTVGEDGILTLMTPVKFYESDYYYYQLGNTYTLDTSEHATEERVYYEKDVYRVAEDVLNIYAKGAAWNTKATMVPCTVTLGVTEPWYELREIGGINSGTNSINGLILKYNKLLSAGESLVRSYNSVQGTLNMYRDTMDRINIDLEPNKLITSDYYGRMTTTNYSINDLLDRISQLEARIQALES